MALTSDGRGRNVGDDRAMIGAFPATDEEAQKAKPRTGENAIDAHPGTDACNRGKGVAKAAARVVKGIAKVAKVLALQSAQDRQVDVPRDQNRMLGFVGRFDQTPDLLFAELRV